MESVTIVDCTTQLLALILPLSIVITPMHGRWRVYAAARARLTPLLSRWLEGTAATAARLLRWAFPVVGRSPTQNFGSAGRLFVLSDAMGRWVEWVEMKAATDGATAFAANRRRVRTVARVAGLFTSRM